MSKAEKSVGPKDELRDRVLLISGERNRKSQGVGYSNKEVLDTEKGRQKKETCGKWKEMSRRSRGHPYGRPSD